MKFKLIKALLCGLLFLSSHAFALADPFKVYGIAGHVLKSEPIRQTGVSYTVKGVTYKTMTLNQAKKYSKTGIASFYHKKFHGRLTSNGEIFNENQFTAAHKTLPINSYVLVTNLENQRKIIVRINDRGPFVKNREIDLSCIAAKKLGISGLAKVKVEAFFVNQDGSIEGVANKTLAHSKKKP